MHVLLEHRTARSPPHHSGDLGMSLKISQPCYLISDIHMTHVGSHEYQGSGWGFYYSAMISPLFWEGIFTQGERTKSEAGNVLRARAPE